MIRVGSKFKIEVPGELVHAERVPNDFADSLPYTSGVARRIASCNNPSPDRSNRSTLGKGCDQLRQPIQALGVSIIVDECDIVSTCCIDPYISRHR